MRHPATITAILGPTNTGKTWMALERMQGYARGMIGFPLRLLARENYDRLVQKHGRSSVALITGEEKIIPHNARFYCCTVEAMPVSETFEFVAVDEIQLCADPERGHIFTDRLLHCRGTLETVFIGAETIKPIIHSLVKGVRFETRPRLSNLSYTGFKKLTRLPKRSAIVAFSADDVYAHADMIRRQKGGAAIVMGALSPRTRNAQVDLYQSGEVDYIVATDAIGMGLNMDIHHVALAATRKFDGKHVRSLRNDELAQIAGRAGRHTRDGSFGITGFIPDLEQESVDAIENHSFETLDHLCWRNSRLNFNSPKLLVKSLEEKPDHPLLTKGRSGDDMDALYNMITRDDVMARAGNPAAVRLLWDVCQIPDFRKVLSDDHHGFAARVFADICDHGFIPERWMETQINLYNNDSGDVDALMTRLAHIRTWTYLTHKQDWLEHPGGWQARTLEIEDRLSDALHQALINRFVDKRNALFHDAINGDKELLAGIRKDGSVIVEGQEIGILKGLRFTADENLITEKGSRTKRILNAAYRALRPALEKRIKHMVNWNMVGAEQGRFTLQENGQIFWQDNKTNPLPGDMVGMVLKGQIALSPEVKVVAGDGVEDAQKAQAKQAMDSWIKDHIRITLLPLFNLMDENNEPLEGAARGIGFQLYESLGVIHRSAIENLVPDLTPELRTGLRRKRVKMGPILVFMPELVKPAAINLRALLWGLWNDKDLPMDRPADGRVSMKLDDPKAVDRNYYRAIGYPVFGSMAIRIDMLDRVVTDIYDTAKDWKFQAQHKYMEWLGCGEEDLYHVLTAMGFRKVRDKEDKDDNAGRADHSGVHSVSSDKSQEIPASAGMTADLPSSDTKETTGEACTEHQPEAGMTANPSSSDSPSASANPATLESEDPQSSSAPSSHSGHSTLSTQSSPSSPLTPSSTPLSSDGPRLELCKIKNNEDEKDTGHQTNEGETKLGESHNTENTENTENTATTETPESPENTPKERKPLATFQLKKGKISERPQPKHKPAARNTRQAGQKTPKKAEADVKPYKKKHKNAPAEKGTKTYVAKAKDIDPDSPFAILQQLKK